MATGTGERYAAEEGIRERLDFLRISQRPCLSRAVGGGNAVDSAQRSQRAASPGRRLLLALSNPAVRIGSAPLGALRSVGHSKAPPPANRGSKRKSYRYHPLPAGHGHAMQHRDHAIRDRRHPHVKMRTTAHGAARMLSLDRMRRRSSNAQTRSERATWLQPVLQRARGRARKAEVGQLRARLCVTTGGATARDAKRRERWLHTNEGCGSNGRCCRSARTGYSAAGAEREADHRRQLMRTQLADLGQNFQTRHSDHDHLEPDTRFSGSGAGERAHLQFFFCFYWN